MIIQLTDKVWFGDWKSPDEGHGWIKSIINVAHHFNEKRGRGDYWLRMQTTIPWETMYFRLAKKDAETIDDNYARSFKCIIEAIKASNAFPLLCHCQMGRHRGPTAALHAAVLLGHPFATVHSQIMDLSKRLGHPKRPGSQEYYESTLRYLERAGYISGSSGDQE